MAEAGGRRESQSLIGEAVSGTHVESVSLRDRQAYRAERGAGFVEDGEGITWLPVASGPGAVTREPTALEQGRTTDRTAGPPPSA